MRRYTPRPDKRAALDIEEFPLDTKKRRNELQRLNRQKRMLDPEFRAKMKARNDYFNEKHRVAKTYFERRKVYRSYGMSVEDYDAMNQRQNGLCYLCQRPNEDSRNRRLAIDHDHQCCKGRGSCPNCVRGLLCDRCNRGLGFFRDDWELLSKAAEYVKTRGGKL